MFRSEIYKLCRMYATGILIASIFVSLILMNILLSGTISGIYITSYDKSGSVTFGEYVYVKYIVPSIFYVLPLLIIIVTAASFQKRNRTGQYTRVFWLQETEYTCIL